MRLHATFLAVAKHVSVFMWMLYWQFTFIQFSNAYITVVIEPYICLWYWITPPNPILVDESALWQFDRYDESAL